ncbi:MAG: hypothetical protein WC055_12570 [Melioribacteraceae bacterium]
MKIQSIEIPLLASLKKGFNFYKNIIESSSFRHFSIPLDCSQLVDLDIQDQLSKAKKSKYDLPENLKISFFRQLDLQNGESWLINNKACLYFFEYSKIQSEFILDGYRKYLTSNKERNGSGLKRLPSLDTEILYVGKVKRNIGSRLSTHFGYAHPHTGGLQLKYWARQMNLQMTVHIIAFNEDIGDFINPLELELTKLLKPLIGKSK